KKELTQWTADLEQLEKSLAEFQAKQATLRDSIDRENAGEKFAKRQAEADTTATTEKEALGTVLKEAKSIAAIAKEAGVEATWDERGEPAAIAASIRHAIQALKQAMAEKAGRSLAQKQALTELIQRFEVQAQTMTKRQTDLEREQAAALADAGAKKK